MTPLYPSWIEIPVNDMHRALAFYRAVFGLTDTPLYDDEPPALIAVLLASDKSVRNPGVSLVKSPLHVVGRGGVVVNFHVGDYTALEAALTQARLHGGTLLQEVQDMGDGVRYVNLLDCEGNAIALSGYEDV
jgi:uncharacterized protein